MLQSELFKKKINNKNQKRPRRERNTGYQIPPRGSWKATGNILPGKRYDIINHTRVRIRWLKINGQFSGQLQKYLVAEARPAIPS